MPRKRRTFTAAFKAKIALEAIREIKTSAALASEYKVHPNQISQWKKELLSNASDVFSSDKKKDTQDRNEISASLYEEIGRLKMDIKWLEKKL